MNNTIKILIILAFSCFSLQTIAQNNAEIDSLIKALETMPEDTNKIMILYDLSYFHAENNPEKHKEYATKMLNLAKKSNNKKGILAAYDMLSWYYENDNKYDSAINCVNKSLKIANNKTDTAFCFRTFGNIYKVKGDFSIAFEYEFKAFNIFKELNDTVKVNELKINLAGTLREMEDNKTALKYYNEALVYFKKDNNIRQQARCLNNIAYIDYLQNNNKISLIKYDQVFELYNSINKFGNVSQKDYADLYGGIGLVYIATKSHLQAENYLKKALKIYEKLENDFEIAIIYNSIAEIKIMQRKFSTSINISKRSIVLLNNIKVLKSRENVSN